MGRRRLRRAGIVTNADETELINAPADELKAALFAIIDENRELRAQIARLSEALEVRGSIWAADDGQALSDLLALISPECDVLRAMRNYLAGHFPPNPEAWGVSAYSRYCDDTRGIFGVQLGYRGDEREGRQPRPRTLTLTGGTIMTRLTAGKTANSSTETESEM